MWFTLVWFISTEEAGINVKVCICKQIITITYTSCFKTMSSLSKAIWHKPFLADRTNGRAYATVLRLSVCRLSVCDVMYCG